MNPPVHESAPTAAEDRTCTRKVSIAPPFLRSPEWEPSVVRLFAFAFAIGRFWSRIQRRVAVVNLALTYVLRLR